MRVRWALEEVGQPYDVRLVSFSEMKEPAHRALHPFGQIPTYEDGDLALFESGRSCSISRSAMLACCQAMRMPGRARSHGCLPRSIRWSRRSSTAALVMLLEHDKSWYEERLPVLEDNVRYGWANFPVGSRSRLARRRVLRR